MATTKVMVNIAAMVATDQLRLSHAMTGEMSYNDDVGGLRHEHIAGR